LIIIFNGTLIIYSIKQLLHTLSLPYVTDEWEQSVMLVARQPWIRSVRVVTGQNGSRQNGTDKLIWTKWYTDKMSLDKMAWTNRHGPYHFVQWHFARIPFCPYHEKWWWEWSYRPRRIRNI